MDKLTKAERSRNMSKIKSKNTLPEILIRKALWRMGYGLYPIRITQLSDFP